MFNLERTDHPPGRRSTRVNLNKLMFLNNLKTYYTASCLQSSLFFDLLCNSSSYNIIFSLGLEYFPE